MQWSSWQLPTCFPGGCKNLWSEMSWISSRSHSLKVLQCEICRIQLNCKAKVANFQYAVLRDEDVVQLHIQVQDAMPRKKSFRLCQLYTPIKEYLQLRLPWFQRRRKEKCQCHPFFTAKKKLRWISGEPESQSQLSSCLGAVNCQPFMLRCSRASCSCLLYLCAGYFVNYVLPP